MNSRLPCVALLAGLSAVGLSVSFGGTAEPDRAEAKPENVFEFAQKPIVTRDGDRITVTFESKRFCDVTIAVEDAAGAIVRHLASGVLGTNAPPPFQKSSLKQGVLWDGKNDKGEYVDDKDSLTVRVSLGLRAQFERTLFWSPRKRAACNNGSPVCLAAAPEGVYVYDGGMNEHIRLFDHEGNYVRTVYPFPASKADQVAGLRVKFPGHPRAELVKWQIDEATLLTHRFSDAPTTWPQTFAYNEMTGGNPSGVGFAVRQGRIALAGTSLNRLATDGSTGGLPLAGPRPAMPAAKEKISVSAALSPDAKWLYTAGYTWGINPTMAAYASRDWMNAVFRLPFEEGKEPTLFAGRFEAGVEKGGAEPGQFRGASCVACDAQGRVYVGDYLNDRIQVFDGDGRYLKSIPAARPASVAVHPKTGDIFVFSWMLWNPASARQQTAVQSTFTQMGPFENPAVKVSCPLPARDLSQTANLWNHGGGTLHRVELDFWAEPPTIWIGEPGTSPRILALKDGKLAVTKDLGDGLDKEAIQPRPPYHGRQRLYCNPKDGKLYVAEQHYPVPVHSKAFWDLVRLDPNTGKGAVVRMPCSAEDMVFDSDGLVYLRTITEVARFDSVNWREVPFDYGEEMPAFGYQFGFARVLGALRFHGQPGPSMQLSGMSVSPKGHVVLTVHNRGGVPDRREESTVAAKGVQEYLPPIYPGRLRHWEIHVFDKHGKRVYEDAVTGIGYMAGVGMDKDDFLYVQAQALSLIGEGRTHANSIACTMLKLDPRKTRIVTNEGAVPLQEEPKRPPDMLGPKAWIEGLQWSHTGVGLSGKGRAAGANCHCQADSRFALDLYGRSFVSETQTYSLVALDSNGNVIMRIGRYGNVDDGKPLITAGGPANARSIGGDEVALMHALYLAVHTDHRLFAADIGNYRILSMKLDYHAEENVALKDVRDRAGKN